MVIEIKNISVWSLFDQVSSGLRWSALKKKITGYMNLELFFLDFWIFWIFYIFLIFFEFFEYLNFFDFLEFLDFLDFLKKELKKNWKWFKNYWRNHKIIIWNWKCLNCTGLRWSALVCASLRWSALVCAGLRCLVHPVKNLWTNHLFV